MSFDLKGRSIALIGGAGFIGHHLALEAARCGADVTVIDALRDGNGEPSSAPRGQTSGKIGAALIRQRLAALREARVTLHVLDATKSVAVADCLHRFHPDSIVHLAAIASVGATDSDPAGALADGLTSLVNTLEYVRNRACHVVYISSSMAYGNFKGEAAMEDDVCEPISLYGALKLSGEQIVRAYGRRFLVPYTIVRPSALYGERCIAGRVGQVYIENALCGNALTVQGDGSDALDFTCVSDLVHGLLLCLTRPEARNQVFNLTYGDARTMNQMIALVKEHFPGVAVNMAPRERLSPKRGTLSIGKAGRLLGYTPKFPLETGFVRYINWYKDLARRNPGLFERDPQANSPTRSLAMGASSQSG
jgi:nucleoside-diphosphate-sugar epimerase